MIQLIHKRFSTNERDRDFLTILSLVVCLSVVLYCYYIFQPCTLLSYYSIGDAHIP
jgi:hypothetical protein